VQHAPALDENIDVAQLHDRCARIRLRDRTISAGAADGAQRLRKRAFVPDAPGA
jgi:hypothetical protein